MADFKTMVTNETRLATPDDADLIPIIDVSEDDTAAISVGNLKALLQAVFDARYEAL